MPTPEQPTPEQPTPEQPTPEQPTPEQPTPETALRERQGYLVRELAVEQSTARLQSLSDELEAVQRLLEQGRGDS